MVADTLSGINEVVLFPETEQVVGYFGDSI